MMCVSLNYAWQIWTNSLLGVRKIVCMYKNSKWWKNNIYIEIILGSYFILGVFNYLRPHTHTHTKTLRLGTGLVVWLALSGKSRVNSVIIYVTTKIYLSCNYRKGF